MPADVTELATSDPDQALQQLNRLYAPARPMRFSGDPEHFDFSLRAAQAGDLHGGRVRHTMTTHAQHAPFDGFLTATVLSGAICWQSGCERLPLRRGGVVRYPTTAGSGASWTDLTVALLRIPLAAVEQAAQAHTGTDPADLRFHTMAPVSAAMTRRWRALTGYVHRTLRADGPMLDSPLISAQLIDMIAVAALAAFPNTTMTAQPRPGSSWVAPPALRRALAYLDDHAAQPVTLADVAGSAGVSPRALQAAFRQHYGMSPLGYLRRVRLDGAHRDLRAGAPGNESVAAIAYRWGFSSPSRFAACYRDVYGVRPSRTLRG